MALTTCAECGAQVSTSAKACPGCGAKPKKPTGLFTKLVAGFIGIVFLQWIYTSATAPAKTEPVAVPKSAEQVAKEVKAEADFQRVVKGAKLLKANAKNPDSFKLESAILMPDDTICYEYRATNSFNAVVLERMTVTAKGGSREATAWNQYCANKTGANMTHARQAL